MRTHGARQPATVFVCVTLRAAADRIAAQGWHAKCFRAACRLIMLPAVVHVADGVPCRCAFRHLHRDYTAVSSLAMLARRRCTGAAAPSGHEERRERGRRAAGTSPAVPKPFAGTSSQPGMLSDAVNMSTALAAIHEWSQSAGNAAGARASSSHTAQLTSLVLPTRYCVNFPSCLAVHMLPDGLYTACQS